MQGAETTNVHPGLRIQDHEQGTLRSVCLAVDSRRVTLTRAEEGSTRRDRPTHQVVRRTTYEVVRGHLVQASVDLDHPADHRRVDGVVVAGNTDVVVPAQPHPTAMPESRRD